MVFEREAMNEPNDSACTGNQRFLFAHDYGMGGIWLYIRAKNPSDVSKIYSKLKYVPAKPKWLLENEKSGEKILEYDLDDVPAEFDALK